MKIGLLQQNLFLILSFFIFCGLGQGAIKHVTKILHGFVNEPLPIRHFKANLIKLCQSKRKI